MTSHYIAPMQFLKPKAFKMVLLAMKCCQAALIFVLAGGVSAKSLSRQVDGKAAVPLTVQTIEQGTANAGSGLTALALSEAGALGRTDGVGRGMGMFPRDSQKLSTAVWGS